LLGDLKYAVSRSRHIRYLRGAIAILMLMAWLLLVFIRRIAYRLGFFTYEVWHPALFNAALYLILLSGLVLALAGRGSS
jgi:protein AaeX